MRILDRTVQWPEQTRLLCWYCSHAFDSIPVFLPEVHPSNSCNYRLRGNFCSWNCVKSFYFYECKDKKKADSSLQGISLLAFLTYHRPKFCPILLEKHTPTCPCLETWKGVSLAPPRHMFSHFGGPIEYKTYRKTAMTINNMNYIKSCFFNTSKVEKQLHHNVKRRMYTYSFFEDVHIQSVKALSNNDTREDEQIPVLFRYGNKSKQKTLF